MVEIYTKTGDTGTTSLWDGTKVGKNDPRIETNGTLDEVNSMIGLAKSLAPQIMREELDDLQSKLITLMSYVVRGSRDQDAPDPTGLEKQIDELMEEYPLGNSFVNPGKTPSGAALHVARAFARRAERTALLLLENGSLDASAYRYINRLSDLLFSLAHKADELARKENGIQIE